MCSIEFAIKMELDGEQYYMDRLRNIRTPTYILSFLHLPKMKENMLIF